MRIENARIFYNGHFMDGAIDFGRTVEAVTGANIGEDFCYVLPGLVDIHTHGAVGRDWSDGDAAGLQPLADHYAAHGVTSFLATTMTLPEAELTAALTALRDHRPTGSAKCAGVHLEGPFLCYGKRGAQPAEYLHAPDIDMLRRLQEVSGGMVKYITAAPEIDGALDFIGAASKLCTVSLGHTEADYETACRAFERGASSVTHLFNAMPPLLHRDPGVIGAALTAGASVELIADGLHVHPTAVLAAHKLFGEKLCLISDSLRAAGIPDGRYTLGGQPIVVQNGRATLENGTLAGSTISVLDGLQNAVRFGVPLEDAVYAATAAPADAAKLDCGRIAVGKAADLTVLNPDLSLRAVYIDGKPFSK
ncbi:MAG: N-acetylglucosamine-6-phosphate deacetylase [Butyricicoccus sp.]|nr:N-acetylglucosamine-6-phosphate deacetylase [Butyricicoccus sp.]